VALMLPSLLTALDAIGRIDLAGTAGYGIWTPGGRAPYDSWTDALLAIGTETARVPGWRAALTDSETGLGPVEAGLAKLATLAPYLPNERRMIHGDLLSHNVLAADGTVTAVLDWGNALYGDHLYDAAWLIYWWPWCPQWRTIDIYAELLTHWHATGPPPTHLHERLHAYLIHIGLDAIAYCTVQRRWDEVRHNAHTVVALTHRAPGEIGLPAVGSGR
jgi:hygromycin-B 4-O-kinase